MRCHFSVSKPTQPLPPNQLPQITTWPQREGARHDAGRPIKPLHGLSMALNIALSQKAKRLEQTQEGHGNEQVNRGVTPKVGQMKVSDKQAREPCTKHASHPCITECAVQFGSDECAQSSPKCHWANGRCGQCETDVNRNDGSELHVY